MADGLLWLEHIKRTSEVYSDFLHWIAEEKDKVRDQYRDASPEKFLQLQAQEKMLDNIRSLCTMRDRENRQQEEFRRTLNGH